MATKEVNQNLEQCSAIAVAGATIAVVILEQLQRKLRVGYLQNCDMQNCDMQFPNLTHACSMLLFILVFIYKKSTHHMKSGGKN